MSTPPVANIHDADSDTHGLPELRLRPREEKRLAAGHTPPRGSPPRWGLTPTATERILPPERPVGR
jgi:hypothetical protein